MAATNLSRRPGSGYLSVGATFLNGNPTTPTPTSYALALPGKQPRRLDGRWLRGGRQPSGWGEGWMAGLRPGGSSLSGSAAGGLLAA